MNPADFVEKYFSDFDLDYEKIFLFYRFLQISPSYRAAHTNRKHGENPPDQTDFNRVQFTYDDFGDVWDNDFQTWWLNIASNQFHSMNTPQPETIFRLNTLTVRERDDIDTPFLRLITRKDHSIYY